MSLVRVEHPHVEIHATLGAVVRGSRVPVRRLWEWHRRGVTLETLWARYIHLPRGQVLDAISFCYDNAELIEREIAHENGGQL